AFPTSAVRLDKYQYSCADSLQANVLDASATAGTVGPAATFTVVNSAGTVLDQEIGIGFTESFAGSHDFASAAVPVRLGSPAVQNNGVLEGDNGQQIVVSYNGSGRATEARARFQCTPNIIQAFVQVPGMTDPSSF